VCIICCKPRGLALPSDEIITQMFTHNNDGFGLAYHHKGDKRVTIRKGAMTLAEARAMIAHITRPKEANVLLHFRTATEGKVCAENCHPYPLSKLDRYLTATSLQVPVAIAHNGIISFKRLFEKGLKRERQFSDTQKFIKHFLSGMGMTMLNKQVTKLIHEYVGGKFALLTPQGFHFIGDFERDKGLSYSNFGYKMFSTTYTYPASCHPLTIVGGVCDLCGVTGLTMEVAEGIYGCKYCFQTLQLSLCGFGIAAPYQGGFDYAD